ncbi:MAG: Hsp33 family molecular chaperone HslO, partial [Pseudomonadota bacterium]
IENQQKTAQALSDLIEKEASFEDLLKNHIGDKIEMKEVKSHKVHYGCTCSREKAAASLEMLEAKDFQEILQSQETLNVDCEMCGLVYQFNFEEVNMIFKKSGKAKIH